jgi:predicted small lipoprotein YifL
MRACAAVAFAVAICGCGQKGPLYLPQKTRAVIMPPAAVVPPPGTAPTAPAAPDEDNGKKKPAPSTP